MGRAQEALEALEAALPMCEAVGSRRGLAAVHHTCGIAYQTLGDLQSAMVHTEQAAGIRAELGERLDLAESRLQQGLLQWQLGRVEEAVRSLQGVLEGSGSTVWSRLRAAAHFGLYEIRRAQGDLAAALDHHVAFHDESRVAMDDRMMLRRQALSIRLKMRQLEHEHERLRTREGELERAASTDALTGLPNRRAVEQRLAVELRRAH